MLSYVILFGQVTYNFSPNIPVHTFVRIIITSDKTIHVFSRNLLILICRLPEKNNAHDKSLGYVNISLLNTKIKVQFPELCCQALQR